MTDDGNDIAMIGTDDHATSTKGDSGKLMVVDAGDIHMTIGVCFDDAHMGTNNATVGTTINKAIIHGGTFGMNSVTECVELKVVSGAALAIRRFAQQSVDRTRWVLVVRRRRRVPCESIDNQVVCWRWRVIRRLITILGDVNDVVADISEMGVTRGRTLLGTSTGNAGFG